MKGVPDSEFSEQFVQGMRDRMAVSFFKYGALADAYPERIDALGSLQLRLEQYAETGNTEFLMDVANYAMIEFMRPRHPRAHFSATDSDGTPGRVGLLGTTKAKNDHLVRPEDMKFLDGD